MKAWRIEGGFGFDNLRQVALEPVPLGPYQVRVAVRAASLNYRDFMMIQGVYNPRQPLPLVPCSDGAGEVVEVGSHVTRVKPGARVMGLFAQGWLAGQPDAAALRTTLGGPLPGMLQQEQVLHEDGVVEIPAHLSFEQASTLPCAALTAWSALEQAELGSGQTVLLQGTGGVSLFALQFARLRGARIVITSKSKEKLERARALGAHDTIDYLDVPKWSVPARALSGGAGVDVVVEVGGGGTLNESIRAVRPGGCIALVGVLAGASSEVLLTPVLMQNLRIQGVIVGHRERFVAMSRAITHAGLEPVIDRVFDFDEVRQAFEHLQSGSHFGKIVVRVG